MDTDKISEKLGITMSQMQRAAAAAIIQGSGNVEVLSPTGSGKTLAYLLPLAQLIDAKSDELQAVVIVPGRELAIQSAEVLASLVVGRQRIRRVDNAGLSRNQVCKQTFNIGL